MAGGEAKAGFKLPSSSLDEIFKVVQGYASVGKLASLSDITKNTGIHATIISKNVGFLLSLGLLAGGKNKAPPALGKNLVLAIMHCGTACKTDTVSGVIGVLKGPLIS